MIQLSMYRPAFGQPSGSPFCVKALILLKMAETDFEIVYQDDPRKTPKGKLPIIVDGDVTVADSSFIRAHLEARLGIDLDAGLSAEQRAVSLAFQRLTEEHLYWSMIAARWAHPDGWAAVRDAYFSKLPGLLRPIISGMVRKDVLKSARGHGMGRHAMAEQFQLGADNLTAIAAWLGDKSFMHGPTPTAIDASVGAFVSAIHDDGLDTPMRATARSNANLAAYAARIRERYFPATADAS